MHLMILQLYEICQFWSIIIYSYLYTYLFENFYFYLQIIIKSKLREKIESIEFTILFLYDIVY